MTPQQEAAIAAATARLEAEAAPIDDGVMDARVDAIISAMQRTGATGAEIDAAVRELMSAPSAPSQVEPPVEELTTVEPVEKPTRGVSERGGRLDAVLTGLRDPIDAGAQLLPRGLSYATSLGGSLPNLVSKYFDDEATRMDQVIGKNEADYQSGRAAAGREGLDLARIGGNILSPANLVPALGAAKFAGAAPKVGAALSPLAAGATSGALQPVLGENPNFIEEKLKQIGIGAALGGAGSAVGAGVSRVIKPRLTPNQQMLRDEGVTLSPGRLTGEFMSGVEDKARSLPIVGDAITGAQRRMIGEFNVAALNRAVAPIGKKVTEPGYEGVKQVRQELGKAYDDLLPKLQFKPDAEFAVDINNIVQMTKSPAFTKADQFEAIVRDRLISKMTPQGNMNGEAWKTAESGLSQQAKRYMSSGDPDQRALGEALAEVLESARKTLVRSNPAQADQLKAINRGYATYARIRRAAGSTGAEEGVFTPAQLKSAVRADDSTVGKRAFSEGDALLQDLVNAGQAVIPSKIPNSGTADRLLLAGATLGSGFLHPAGALSALLGGAAYTRPGVWAADKLLAARPQMAGRIAQPAGRAAQYATPLALLPSLVDREE